MVTAVTYNDLYQTPEFFSTREGDSVNVDQNEIFVWNICPGADAECEIDFSNPHPSVKDVY